MRRTLLLLFVLALVGIVRVEAEDIRPDGTPEESDTDCTTSNAHTQLDEDVSSPDGLDCSADASDLNPIIRLAFATPTLSPTTDTDDQQFAFVACKNQNGGGNDPTLRADVYCNGSLHETGASQSIAGNTGCTDIYTDLWTFGGSCAGDGSDVEVRLVCTAASGPNRSCAVRAVEWRSPAPTTARRVILISDNLSPPDPIRGSPPDPIHGRTH